MGFSLTGAAAIIGISIFVVAEMFAANLLPAVTDTNDSYNDMKERIVDQIQTDITIANATTSDNGTNYDLNITVENTGGITLEVGDFNILINGTGQQFTCSSSYLYIGSEVYFNVTNLSGTGPRRLKVVTSNGISDYYDYII